MISWKKWRIGLLVAGLTGGLTGLISLAVGAPWRAAAYLVAISMAKDMVLYLTVPGYRDKVLSSLPDDALPQTPQQQPKTDQHEHA